MRDNQSFLVGLIVTFIVVIWAVLVGLSVYENDVGAFMIFIAIGMIVGTFIAYKSITVLKETTNAEVYLFGTRVGTFANGSFLESLTNTEKTKCERELKIRRGYGWGLEDTDWIFALWPFYKTILFPTTGNKVFLHANKVFTRGENVGKGKQKVVNHRVMLEADPTFFVWFFTIRKFIPIVERSKNSGYLPHDLTVQCPINAEDPDHSYEGSRLAKILMDEIEELFLEALRKAAAYFEWGGQEDIIQKKRELEMAVLYELAEPGSILYNAGIVRRPMKGRVLRELTYEECLQTKTLADFYGPDVKAVDINIEGINLSRLNPNASDAEKAVNAPFVGKQSGLQEGLKTAEAGKGQAIADKAIQDATGNNPGPAVILEQLKGTGASLNVTLIGGGLQELAEKIVKPPNTP